MVHTAMQDLRQDLLDTILSGSNALNEIEDQQIKVAAKNLFETTINTIISRIDEELLEMEKQQIIDACEKFGNLNGVDIEDYKQYYEQTFNK